MDFDAHLQPYKINILNKPKIFGNQLIVDEEDHVLGEEANLLINATKLDVVSATALAREHGAAVYPAHVDRQGNGIIAILGDLPEKPQFSTVEFHDESAVAQYEIDYPSLRRCLKVVCSDSHYLENIPDAAHALEIADEPYSSALVRKKLIEKLKGGAM